jgi:Holliday junction DNA helicase RuvB
MMDEERVLGGGLNSGEAEFDLSLRPRAIEDYIGQEKVKERLMISLEAARLRNDVLGHCLLYGPPGLGKTTLAGIIANYMGVNIRITSGPAIEKTRDLAAILTNLSEGDVLFIDEIHRLNTSVEEVLYPAMEDFALDIIIGQGPSARSLRLDLPGFTLIGATTKAGMLAAPLLNRFTLKYRLEMYNPEELKRIVERSAGILGISIDDGGGMEIACRSRGTPRIANRLLRLARDYAQVKADGIITREVAFDALKMEGVDKLGLDDVDRHILRTIVSKFNGGPVGLETLAAATNEESVTIEDVCEPYLLQLGFIKRTPRGRVAMPAAYEHLSMTPPENGPEQLRF